jgi:Tfp pilus assembly protein PilW
MSNLVSTVNSSSGAYLGTPITYQSISGAGSTAMTITGGLAERLYVLTHVAYKNAGGLTTSLGTPSGFTSIVSYDSARIMYRLSYKILTADEIEYTLPSYTGADYQLANAHVFTPINSTITGVNVSIGPISVANSGESSSEITRDVLSGDIAYGQILANGAGGVSTSNNNLVLNYYSENNQSITGGSGTLILNTTARIFDYNDTARFTVTTTDKLIISTMVRIRPTFA